MRVSRLFARTEPLIKISLTIAEARTLWHIANAAAGVPLSQYCGNSEPDRQGILTFKSRLFELLNPIFITAI